MKILRYASLFVFLAGTLSTSEAVYHGVPMIATTFAFAEPEWCTETNIVRLGMGVYLRRGELSVDTIRYAATRIAEYAETCRNVERVGHLIRREAGREEVVKMIDECLRMRATWHHPELRRTLPQRLSSHPRPCPG